MKSKVTLFEILCVLCILHNVPIVGYLMPDMVYPLITVATFLLAIFSFKGNGFVNAFSQTVVIMLIPILQFALGVYTGQFPFSFGFYRLLQDAIYPIIGIYLIKYNNTTMARRLLFVFLIVYTITAITTIYGCVQFPYAARQLTGNQEETALYSQYKLMNIGDFHFVYFLTFSIPLIVYAFQFKMAKRIVVFLVLAVAIAAIYMSSYTTALLMSFFGMVLMFVPHRIIAGLNVKKMIGIVIIAIIANGLFVPLINSLAGYVGVEDVSERLTDVSAYMSSGEIADEGSDMGIRYMLFSKSIESFFSNPLIGSLNWKTVGGHSYILDALGVFGLMGLLAYLLMFSKIYNLFVAPYQKKELGGYALVTFGLVLLQTVLNPQPSLLTTTLFVPVFCIAASTWKNKTIRL